MEQWDEIEKSEWVVTRLGGTGISEHIRIQDGLGTE